MIVVDGKSILSEMSELVDPSRAALVLVDIQRDFVERGFAFDALGIDLSMYPAMILRTSRLLHAARRAGLRVVHIQMTTLPGRQSDSPAQMRFNMRMHSRFRRDRPPLTYSIMGTKGHEFIDAVKPLAGEMVVQKYRSSGFWGTNLNMLLRSNGIETLLMAGCTTEGCVESTARDGLFNDFYVVIVEDCVASDDREQHDASLLLMRNRFDVSSSDEIIGIWNSGPHETGRD